MKIVVQKSKEASVIINDKIYSDISSGLVLLVGFTEGDSLEQINYLAKKIVNLRIFEDEQGIMNKSILDIGGEILSISQFTLYADSSKGNRPSYTKALSSDKATTRTGVCEQIITLGPNLPSCLFLAGFIGTQICLSVYIPTVAASTL